MDIHDVTNITGISALLNSDKIDRALDMEAMEENMIDNSHVVTRDQIDPAAEYSRIMQELGGDTNPTYAGDFMDDTEVMSAFAPGYSAPQWEAAPRARPAAQQTPAAAAGPLPPMPQYSPQPQSSSNYNPYGSRPAGPAPSYGQSSGYGSAYPQQPDPNRGFERGAAMYNNNVVTDEDVVLEDIEDQKLAMLQDIEELLEELTTMGRDVSRIPRVNNDTDFDQIRRVHGIVRRKYDFSRGETFGTDLIISGAQALGALFDGTRSIGPFRPHLKGWHNTIRPKLRKMRYETARTVSAVMAAYDIGPGTRMAIELIPSAFIYSNMHTNSTDKYNPDAAASTFSDLRDFE